MWTDEKKTDPRWQCVHHVCLRGISLAIEAQGGGCLSKLEALAKVLVLTFSEDFKAKDKGVNQKGATGMHEKQRTNTCEVTEIEQDTSGQSQTMAVTEMLSGSGDTCLEGENQRRLLHAP